MHFVRTPLRPNRLQDNKKYDLWDRYVADCSGSASCLVMVFASSIRPNGYPQAPVELRLAEENPKHLTKNLLSSGALLYNIS